MRKDVAFYKINRIYDDLNLKNEQLNIDIELAETISLFLKARYNRTIRSNRPIAYRDNYCFVSKPYEIVKNNEGLLMYKYNTVKKVFIIRKVANHTLMEESYNEEGTLLHRRYYKYSRRKQHEFQ